MNWIASKHGFMTPDGKRVVAMIGPTGNRALACWTCGAKAQWRALFDGGKAAEWLAEHEDCESPATKGRA